MTNSAKQIDRPPAYSQLRKENGPDDHDATRSRSRTGQKSKIDANQFMTEILARHADG